MPKYVKPISLPLNDEVAQVLETSMGFQQGVVLRSASLEWTNKAQNHDKLQESYL